MIHSLFSQNPEAHSAMMEEKLVVMSPLDQVYYHLNAVGTKIWTLFNEQALSLKEVATFLQETYQLPEERAFQDAQRFLEQMLQLEIIKSV